MDNLIIIQSDSSSEEVITTRPNRVSSKIVKDNWKSNNTNQELSFSEISEDFSQSNTECCSICLLYFNKNTSWLPWGHIFHHSWVLTQQNWLKIKEWPLWKYMIESPQEVIKLFIDPNELGSENIDILSWSNKRLKKKFRKLISKHEKLKEHLEAKERQAFILKTLIKQHDAIERETFDEKEVDLQTKEKYLEGIFHACCQSNDCEHAHKFKNALSSLKWSSRSASKCQNIIITANKKFIKHIIKNGQKAMRKHSFESFLPFYIERCRKIDYLIDIGEFNKRWNLFRYREEVFEVFKDFGTGYDQEELKIYKNLVNDFKNSIIEFNDSQPLDDDTLAPWNNVAQREYIYDKDQRKRMLDQACKQLTEKQDKINILTKEITRKSHNSKRSCIENYKKQLTLLKEQSELLDRIKRYIVTREESFLYYKTEQERKEYQVLKYEQNKKRSEVKSWKSRAYRKWRSERFRKFKANRLDKDIRGIKASEQTQQDRAFSDVWNRIYYKQEIIDFEALFKIFNLSF